MPEHEDDFEKAKQQARISAYYSALTDAWVSTKFEKDKSLLTISAGAIGLLVTLLTTLEISSLCIIGYFAFAFLFFSISIICIIFVFDRNAKHVANVINDKEDDDKVLNFLDNSIIICFLLGVLFTIIISSVYAIDKYNKRIGDKKVSKKVTLISKKEIAQNSLREISELKPKAPKSPKKDKKQ